MHGINHERRRRHPIRLQRLPNISTQANEIPNIAPKDNPGDLRNPYTVIIGPDPPTERDRIQNAATGHQTLPQVPDHPAKVIDRH